MKKIRLTTEIFSRTGDELSTLHDCQVPCQKLHGKLYLTDKLKNLIGPLNSSAYQVSFYSRSVSACCELILYSNGKYRYKIKGSELTYIGLTELLVSIKSLYYHHGLLKGDMTSHKPLHVFFKIKELNPALTKLLTYSG